MICKRRAQIGTWEGGSEVVRDNEHFIRYAGIADQYFASVIVVDKDQKDQKFLTRPGRHWNRPWQRARLPPFTRTASNWRGNSNVKETFYFSDRLRPLMGAYKVDTEVALWYYTDPEYRLDNEPDLQKRAARGHVRHSGRAG